MVIFDVSDRHGAVCLSVSVTCAVVPCALSPLCPCIPEAVDAFFFIIIIILSFFIFPFWLFCWFFFLFCFGLVWFLFWSHPCCSLSVLPTACRSAAGHPQPWDNSASSKTKPTSNKQQNPTSPNSFVPAAQGAASSSSSSFPQQSTGDCRAAWGRRHSHIPIHTRSSVHSRAQRIHRTLLLCSTPAVHAVHASTSRAG